MTLAGEALSALRRLLAAWPSADLDAELLLAHVLGIGRAGVKADPSRPLSARQAQALSALAARRAAGEPVAYLTRHREFWSLDLEVTPEVLVPRPETELVVELALDALARIPRPAVLDLGTGSGAIAIAIAIAPLPVPKECPWVVADEMTPSLPSPGAGEAVCQDGGCRTVHPQPAR